MSNSAYIRDIASLEQLRIAIARFCEESEDQLHAIDLKLQSRISNLESLESQFQRMVESAQYEFDSARSSLSICESNIYEDEDGNTIYPDCENERSELIISRERLELAQHNYSSFRREIRNLKNAIDDYQNPKIKYKTLIQFEKEAATNSLKQLINGAEDYLSVSALSGNGFSTSSGITESISKIDPTIIVAASIGVAEILMMSMFSFLGEGGKLFNVTNTRNNIVITTTYFEKGEKHVCSELKIEKKENGNMGKILSINIPISLHHEKIGKHLINNMEATCRANDCEEISGWATTQNLYFYRNLGYQSRNEVKESGAEVFKILKSNYYSSQQKAKSAFENVTKDDFIKTKKLGKQEIEALNIITPDEMNEEKFWGQHGEDQDRYLDLIEKYDKCRQLLQSGKTLDEIRKEDSWVANAYDVFNNSEPVRLQKTGGYYRIGENGRHRVAAAQIYYLNTGRSVPIVAEVSEKQ